MDHAVSDGSKSTSLPIHKPALVGLIATAVAFTLSLFGMCVNYHILGTTVPAESTRPGWLIFLLLGLTDVLPVFLASYGMYVAYQAMSELDNAEGKLRGDGFTVFAMLIGSLTLVTAFIMILADLVWPRLIAAEPYLNNVLR